MAKRVELDVQQHEDGSVWIAVIHCDGSIGDYVEIPCPCQDEGGGGVVVEPPDTEWCNVACSLANKIMLIGQDWEPHVDVELTFAASVYLVQKWSLPITSLPLVQAYLFADTVAFQDITWATDGLLQLETGISCAAFEALNITGGRINDAFISAFQTALRDNTEIDRCNMQGWDAIADLLELFPLSFWQLAGFEFTAVSSGIIFWDGCECASSDIPECGDEDRVWNFDDPALEDYDILLGVQGVGYISDLQIPSGGFPAYGIPGSSSPSARGVYVTVNPYNKVGQVRMTFRFRRYAGAVGSSTGVGVLLYCYDASNMLLFGRPLGGSIVKPQDTDIVWNFNISSQGACIDHMVAIVNYATSDAGAYIQMLKLETFTTIPPA